MANTEIKKDLLDPEKKITKTTVSDIKNANIVKKIEEDFVLDTKLESNKSSSNFFIKFLSKLQSFTIIGQFQILIAFYLVFIVIFDRSILALILILWLILSVIAKKVSILRLLKKAPWNQGKKSYTDKNKMIKIKNDKDL